MFCTNCGKHLPSNSKFCVYCGSLMCDAVQNIPTTEQPAEQTYVESVTVAPFESELSTETVTTTEPILPETSVLPVEEKTVSFYESEPLSSETMIESEISIPMETAVLEPSVDEPVEQSSDDSYNFVSEVPINPVFLQPITQFDNPMPRANVTKTSTFARIFATFFCCISALISLTIILCNFILSKEFSLVTDVAENIGALPLGMIVFVISLCGIFSLILPQIKALRVTTASLMWGMVAFFFSGLFLVFAKGNFNEMLSALYDFDIESGSFAVQVLWIFLLTIVILSGLAMLVAVLTKKSLPIAVTLNGMLLGIFSLVFIYGIGRLITVIYHINHSTHSGADALLQSDVFWTPLFLVLTSAIFIAFATYLIFAVSFDAKSKNNATEK